MEKVPAHDLLLVIGDLSAKVGNDNTSCEQVMGKQGCGSMNDKGERLSDFCMENGLVIGGSLFPHQAIYKLTWVSHSVRDKNQIAHVVVNQQRRRSLFEVRTVRGADVGSDHHLLRAVLKLKATK